MYNKFTLCFLLFCIFFIFIRIRDTFFRAKTTTGIISHKWTLNALTIVYCIICISALIEYFVIDRKINILLSSLGFTIFISSILLRNWAIKALGDCYSPHIKINTNHILKKNGPYKFVRHPIYTSIIFEFLGAIIIPNSYYSLLAALFIYIPLLMIRLYFEEKELIIKFGDQYLNYKKEVASLIPYKYSKLLDWNKSSKCYLHIF